MSGRLGTRADVLLSESVLSKIADTAESMLLEKPSAGMILSGDISTDANGRFVHIIGISDSDPVALCVASEDGGTEPSDNDLILFKKFFQNGILMKIDVYAHEFSFYRIGETVEDATVLFIE